MTVQIRRVKPDEFDDFQHCMSVPFGVDATPERRELFSRVFSDSKLWSAFDGDQIVATFGSIDLELSVPGGTLPTAGTTVVTVLSTHRRNGLLRTLMREHLDDAHRSGQPLAALWASESNIYGRFGYGPASQHYQMSLPKQHAHLATPCDIAGTMRWLTIEHALETFPTVYAGVAQRRPGMFARDASFWEHRVLSDPPDGRRGGTALRPVVHLRDGEAVGYVLYRTRTDHAAETMDVVVKELIGIDPDAERALWQYLFGIDLATSISYWNQPVDDPVEWWLEQPRCMERRIADAIWVRPLDIAAALSGRRYCCAGSLVIRIRDTFCPWNDGAYRLDANADGTAACTTSTEDPQIEMTAFELGAIYLGGHRVMDLARSGLIKGNSDALTLADTMFAWHERPWCQEVF